MPSIDHARILAMDRFDRVNFIHSLAGFKSPVLIGTRNGKYENLAIFSSLMHLGSSPPLLALKFRPITPEKQTYHNIKRSGLLTINLIGEEFYTKAHSTSARLPKEISEFEIAELTSEYINGWKAPFVKASKIKYAAKFCEEYKIKANKTIVMVLEIKEVHYDEGLLMPNKSIDLAKAKTIAINGLYGYHKAEKLSWLPYVSREKLNNSTD